ncbi:MAG TPA: type II secretion system F family protein [Nocardioides sp.]|uniref:type II secretion system F family protein n=1 Tax=Nocardioides sp. TaxID=35761 RepID=UPI002D7E8926|nr:type II secretion system F family protein [Nocardioides sp.]HET6651193.1 type II secretion system F family protein [Nocardioides sp.]
MTGIVLAATLAAVLAAAAVLLSTPPGAALPARSRDAPGPSPDRKRLLPVLAGAGAMLAVTLFIGGPVGLGMGAVAAVGSHLAVRRMEPPAARRRREALVAGLPHVVDLLAACLAAGQSPGTAIDEVAAVVTGPLRDELAAVSARLRLGVDPVTVWRELSRHPELGVWGRCMLRAADSGASVADAMARLAEDLRLSARAAVEARARAVGVRAALPLGACLLPAFVLLGVVPLVAGSLSVLSLP